MAKLIDFLVAHWGTISGAATLVIVSVLNHHLGGATAQGWLRVLLDLLAVKSAKGESVRLVGTRRPLRTGGLMLPLVMRSAPKAKPRPVQPSSVAGLGLALLLVPMLALAGCAYCLDPAHKDEAKCKILGSVVDCSKVEIQKAIADVLPAVLAVLSGGTIDWGALGRLEAAHGFELIACAIARLDFLGQSPPPPDFSDAEVNVLARANAGRIHQNAAAYFKQRKVEVKPAPVVPEVSSVDFTIRPPTDLWGASASISDAQTLYIDGPPAVSLPETLHYSEVFESPGGTVYFSAAPERASPLLPLVGSKWKRAGKQKAKPNGGSSWIDLSDKAGFSVTTYGQQGGVTVGSVTVTR